MFVDLENTFIGSLDNLSKSLSVSSKILFIYSVYVCSTKIDIGNLDNLLMLLSTSFNSFFILDTGILEINNGAGNVFNLS